MGYTSLNVKNSFKKVVLAALLGVFFFACVEKDTPPEPEPQVLLAKFDQTEYFPFDAIAITLSEKATKQEYNGTLGDTPVTAYRMNDTTLVVMAPDMQAGDYQLTIPLSDKPNEKKAQGRIRIKPLPTVDNPDVVIEEITTTFAQIATSAKEENDPDAALIEWVVNSINTELAKLSPAERRQLAAYLAAHPELNYAPDIEPRTSFSEIKTKFRRDYVNYFNNFHSLRDAIAKFSFTYLIALCAPNPVTIIISGFSLANLIMYAKDTNNAHKQLVADPFIALTDSLNSGKMFMVKSQQVTGINNHSGGIVLTNGDLYDVTLKNGESLLFNPQIDIRSIAAQDITGAAPPEAKEIISSTSSFLSFWNELLDNIIKVTADLLLSGSPKDISTITTPIVETVTIDDWSLQIVSGDVTAQKTDANTYTFTTTSTEHVEFQFKVIAEDITSQVFTALLEVDMPPEITTTSLPEGKEGEPYSYTITATGTEPISWVIIDGITPVGIRFSFNNTEVIISGIPVETGTFTFTIKAANEYGEDTKTLSMTIKEQENQGGEGDIWVVGTWWDRGMYATYSSTSGYTLRDRCGNSVEIKSQADLRAYYENNLGVITINSDGTFQFKSCGVVYTGTYEADGWNGYHHYFNLSHPNLPCKGSIDFSKELSDFPLSFCGLHEYRKVSGSMEKAYFTVSPSTAPTFAPTGEQMTFTVSSNTFWTVKGSDWTTVWPEGINKNDGTVVLTVHANDFWERNGGFGFTYFGGDVSIPITQEEAPPPIISTSSLNFAASGGEQEFTVTSTTSWDISAESWLTVSPSSLILDGTEHVTTPVKVTAETYTASSQRTTFIRVMNNNGRAHGTVPLPMINITQEGATRTLTVSPSTLNFFESGGYTQYFTITANTPWTAASDASWITVSPTSRENNYLNTVTVGIVAAENTGTSQRTATVTVSGTGVASQTVTITQEGATSTPMPTLTVEPTALSFIASGGQQSFIITANTDWTVSSNDSWATISPASGSNNGTVTVTTTANTGTSARTTTVTVGGTGVTPQTVSITQEGTTPSGSARLDVMPPALGFLASGGQKTFTITSNTTWTVSIDASWFTVSPASGSNNGTVTVTVEAMTGDTSRIAIITVTGTGVSWQPGVAIHQVINGDPPIYW